MTRLYLVGWLLAATDGEYTLMALGASALWGLTLGLAFAAGAEQHRPVSESSRAHQIGGRL